VLKEENQTKFIDAWIEKKLFDKDAVLCVASFKLEEYDNNMREYLLFP